MSYDNRGDDSSGSEDAIVEQEVISPVHDVDDILADLVAAPEMGDELGPAQPRNKRPWYKTPSVWWLLPITVIWEIARGSRIAPQTELYIKFACDELRPEYRVDTNAVGWDSALRVTEIDAPKNVPVTFIESHPVLGDRIMKPMLLRPDKRCAQDPGVQRAAARLSAAITSVQGILSLLTLGWWSQYSDRAGRTKVLAISAVADVFADALLFLVVFKADILPGGYRMLILVGVLQGLSGGFATVIAAGHAYVADCTSPLARSRAFSFWSGCLHAGVAVGQNLGSSVNYYSNDLLSTFYMSGIVNIIHAILMAFVVPESLSDEARAKARELYEVDMNSHSYTMLGFLWRLTSVIRPLGVFIPRRLPAGRGGWKSRDWNLALIGVAAAAVEICLASHPFQHQYAMKAFQWSSVQVGYWLSLLDFWRALYLSVILPVIIKTLYAREERFSNGTDEEKESQVKRIDLLVARASLVIDLVGYTLVGVVSSPTPFIGATIILAFGGGFASTTQSLALALANPSAHIGRREARARGISLPSGAKLEIGRLFGAFAVIRSLGRQVIGSALFSAVFGATVGVYPRAFFWVCGFLVALALGALGALRLDITPMGRVSGYARLPV